VNEEIILNIAKPYVKDSAITYDEFDQLFSILSRKEQYAVCDVLFNNGINLVDSNVAEDALVLDIDAENNLAEDFSADDFEIHYDEDPFRDRASGSTLIEELVLNKEVRQSNDILCRLIQQGNRQAVQDLCVKNHRLVSKYVFAYGKRYANRLDSEDLEQVGFMGLIKAAQKFDLSRGVSFSTYAVHWIKQAIAREIMDHGYAIRIPVHMMERINKVVATDNRLAGEGIPLLERIRSVADELGISEDDVREALALRNNYLMYSSLDMPVGEDQDSVLGDFIPFDEELSVEQIIFDKELHQELETIIATLKPKEREILKLRFGWNDNHPKTLEEIGTLYGVTRERIRQIEAKAIRRLRHPSRSRRLKDFQED
jgi:RNA polymerase primary sigma factor